MGDVKTVRLPPRRGPVRANRAADEFERLVAGGGCARYDAATRDGRATFERLLALADDLVDAGEGGRWVLSAWGLSTPAELLVEPPRGWLELGPSASVAVTVEGRALVLRAGLQLEERSAAVGYARYGAMFPLRKGYAAFRAAWEEAGTRAAFARDPLASVRARSIGHLPRDWVAEAWRVPAVREGLTRAVVALVTAHGTIRYGFAWPSILGAALGADALVALREALAAALGPAGAWRARWDALLPAASSSGG